MLKHELRSLFFLPDKHVVLVGELKMPACGLCMAADKKAALVVKTVCLHKSFSKLRPLPSFCRTFSFIHSPSPSLRVFPLVRMEIQILALSLIPTSNKSIAFLYKAHAIALTLTVTLSLTQTDVIKRLFICSQNPACLPTTILWFCHAGSPSHQRGWRGKLYSYSCFNN